MNGLLLLLISVVLLASVPAQGAGVELHLQYSAIQKVLNQQVFTEGGRLYVKGTPKTKCAYAYMEKPALGGEQGKLRIEALFNGRNAANFFGKCIGLGDEFAVRIRALPFYEQGVLRLKDVEVETAGKQTFYARKVKETIQEKLPKAFAYPVSTEARKILETRRGNEPYQQQLQSFQITRMQVTAEALVLWLEFTLVVK
ncbi:MAG: hypothetical protein JNK87_38240 [Bryobacterales bacterium]|nr:hypothetical protein [Bryobacterales bacterium]